MSEIAEVVERIRRVAGQKGGLVDLAQESGVPYTTVHSFAKREFTHKNLEVIEKLGAAAERIAARRADDEGSQAGEAAA